jgi:hypothetical protein
MKKGSRCMRTDNFSTAVVKLLTGALGALVLAGCATTIPVTDTQQPEITLIVTGPGVGRQQMTDPPKDSWTGPGGVQLFDLKPNTVYRFTLTVSDQGGAARAQLRMPVSFTVTELAPATVVQVADSISRSLTLQGSRANPVTGLIISGSFRTPDTGSGLSFEFQTEGDDFGGASGRPNQRFMNVSASVGAH